MPGTYYELKKISFLTLSHLFLVSACVNTLLTFEWKNRMETNIGKIKLNLHEGLNLHE